MFPDLPEAVQIILYILIGLAAAWLLALIMDLVFFFFFRSALKRHARWMTVTLNAKYENVKKIYEIIKFYNIEVDPKILQELDKIDINVFKVHDTLESENARNMLSYLKDEATFISNKNKILFEKADFQLARNNVLELDVEYRSNIAIYNADVLGYNYWISFLPCRFIFKICKIKKKNLIA